MTNFSISAVDFLHRLESPQDDFCVLDVRSEYEVSESKLTDPRIQYIPMQDIPNQLKNLSKEKNLFH